MNRPGTIGVGTDAPAPNTSEKWLRAHNTMHIPGPQLWRMRRPSARLDE
jgi:hypothetical protein